MPRTTLYENTHVLIDALLDPAGGLTLRRLTTGTSDGYHLTLTINETQALRALLAGPPPLDLALDDMVTVLSVSGYLVRSPDDDLEPLMKALAHQYGYGLIPPNALQAAHGTPAQPPATPLDLAVQTLKDIYAEAALQAERQRESLVPPADQTQTTTPQPALVSHAELTQRMAPVQSPETGQHANGTPDEQSVHDRRNEAIAALRRNWKILESRFNLPPVSSQDAPPAPQAANEMPVQPPNLPGVRGLQPALVSHAEIIQRMNQVVDHRDEALAAQNSTHAPYPETVLQHCVDADYARQGVAVETEIRALLTHYRIPADSPYGDWSSELAKHEPQRWPDTTQTESEAH